MLKHLGNRLLIVLASLFLILAYVPAHAVPIYVDSSATDPDPDGSSWIEAFPDLQSGLAAAVAPCSIWVAAGTYYPATGVDRDSTFQLVSGVAIYGGFAGIEASLSERNWVANVTILSGDIGTPADSTDNSYHVVTGSGTNSTAVLDGFTVTRGYASGAGAEQNLGGGMYNQNGSPSVSNVIFTKNVATTNGGGGMFNRDGSNPTLINVTFAENSALPTSGDTGGGGMYNFTNCHPTLTNVVFENNSTPMRGGGMYNFINCNPTLTNVTFTENSAGWGGGIFNDYGNPELTNVTFLDNSAGQYGGGVCNWVESSPALTNVTFSGNSAGIGGGGMLNRALSNATLVNTILWGNSAPSGPEIYNTIIEACSLSYSLIKGSLPTHCVDVVGNIFDENPLFADAPGGDLRLIPISPAVNAGNNAAPNLPLTDLDGSPRIAGIAVDMGAYEFPCPPGPVVYVDADATGSNDGTSWDDAFNELQEALEWAPCASVTQIWVAAGTYKPTADTNRDATFQLVDSLAIYGGFSGGETSISQRDWVANETILSGDIGSVGLDTDNSYHVVTGSGTDSTAVLDGFTVTKGYANKPPAATNGVGAGVYINPGSPTLSNLVFRDNVAVENGGGGVFAGWGSNPTLANVVFTGNSATGNGVGGGMYSQNSAPTLTNVIFSGNSADDGGGMMNNTTGNATLINVVFWGNSARSDGGGMSNSNTSNATLINVIFSGNSAISYGGGMMNNINSTPTLVNTILWGDSGGTDDEIANLGGSQPVISYSLVEGSGGSSSWDTSLGTDGGNNIDADPLFLDPSAGNLRLIPTSPAVDAGDSTVANLPPTDLDGNPRVLGNNVDMGAYESQASCPPGTVLYVDANATGAGDGASWADAFTELRNALAWLPFCPSVTEVWVAAGTYRPTTGTDRKATFQLVDSLAIYGGFVGGETSRSERDWATNVTILSGDIGVPADSTDNSYHVVTASGTDSTAVLDGFTITGGNADAPATRAALAQAELSSDADLKPTVSGPPIAGSRSSAAWIDTHGGGLYNNGGGPTLVNVIFSNNYAVDGGGMYNDSASPTLTNVVFSGNSALWGGGMHNYDGSHPILANVIFRNGAADFGGGMYNNWSNPELVNATFSSSTAHRGGGIYNNLSDPVLVNTILWGDSAVSGGDEIYNAASTPEISYSLIEGSGGSGGSWDDSLGNDGGNNLDADPLFIDALAGNLRPLGGSPAIDAGNDAVPYLPATDFDGNQRILGAAVDMGAYEYPCPPGQILYVDSGATGANEGTSWADAFTELGSALRVAPFCPGVTEIWVAGGTYKPTANAVRTATFKLVNGVAVYGGFAGTEMSRSERDWVANVTILGGDIGTPADSTDNSYHVVTGSGTDSTAVLDGFTISGGYADHPDAGNHRSVGGGMYNDGGSPTVVNVTFVGNISVSHGGGGMYNGFGSSPALTNVMFTENSTSGSGGGVYNWDNSNPAFTNVIFWANSSAGTGGGMQNGLSSSPTLTNVTFSRNSADYGGGIYNWNGSNPELVNTILWDDSAATAGNEIYNDTSVPVISHSLVEGSGGSGAGWDMNLGTDDGRNIDADPVFVDGPGGDLHINRVASPANNAGSNSSLPGGVTTDLDGNPRIVGIAVDVGAYEYPCLPGPVLYVDAGAAGLNDGSSWTDAFNELRKALEWAPCASVTEVWVAAGTYKPTAGTDRTASFQLADSVSVYGGFAGTETSVSERDWATNVTTLSGDIGTPDVPSDNSYHVVVCGQDVWWPGRLDGFTVTRGRADGVGTTRLGGGMYSLGSPAVANVTFVDNHARQGGGMHCAEGLSVTLSNVKFWMNIADSIGGGMYNGGMATLTDVEFDGNSAVDGAGVYNGLGSGLMLTDATFHMNIAMNTGGGICNHPMAGHVELYDATLTMNEAVRGGGMFTPSGPGPAIVILSNVTFENNHAMTTGGGIYSGVAGPLMLENVSFISNMGDSAGGGMYNGQYSNPNLINVTFLGNTSQYGGGMYNGQSSMLELTNVTSAMNSADYGGGMYNWNINSATIVNTILWGNDAFTGRDEIHNEPAFPVFSVEISYSLIEGCYSFPSRFDSLGLDMGFNLDADPLFVNPFGDLHLLLGSPAIDAGNNGVPYLPPYDRDGNARIVAGIVDMGAYEFQAVPSASAFPAPLVFSEAPVNQATCDTIYVVNDGGALCTIAGISGCTTAPFSMDTSMTVHSLATGDTTKIVVCVTPTVAGPDTAEVTVVSDAWNSPTVVPVRLEVVTAVESDRTPKPFRIVSVTPNPFNPSTTVHFTLPAAMPVTAVIYSVTGARIRGLASEERFGPGDNRLVWDGRTDRDSRAASGVYFIRVETRLGARVARAVLLK